MCCSLLWADSFFFSSFLYASRWTECDDWMVNLKIVWSEASVSASIQSHFIKESLYQLNRRHPLTLHNLQSHDIQFMMLFLNRCSNHIENDPYAEQKSESASPQTIRWERSNVCDQKIRRTCSQSYSCRRGKNVSKKIKFCASLDERLQYMCV